MLLFNYARQETSYLMNRQETLDYLTLILRHDLNDNLSAFALRTVLGEIIKAIRSLVIQPEEATFLQERNAVLATLQSTVMQQADKAVGSEHTNRGRKTAEKGYAARNDYSRAASAIEQALREFIVATERSQSADV